MVVWCYQRSHAHLLSHPSAGLRSFSLFVGSNGDRESWAAIHNAHLVPLLARCGALFVLRAPVANNRFGPGFASVGHDFVLAHYTAYFPCSLNYILSFTMHAIVAQEAPNKTCSDHCETAVYRYHANKTCSRCLSARISYYSRGGVLILAETVCVLRL